MSQEVDWLHSQAGLCKVDLYKPEGQKDQDRKVISFVDVSSLNLKATDPKAKQAASQSSNISEHSNELDLVNMEEKEVIVIKDNEKQDRSKTEGTVCLFKQGSTDELNIVSWLNNDLQKYAVGFQHALAPSDNPPKRKGSDSFKNTLLYQNNDTSLKCTGAQKENKGDTDDVSYYVNKLCSLVAQMASKEITDKLEGTAQNCIRQAIHRSTHEGKNNNTSGDVSKIASQIVNEAVEASTQDPRGKLPSPKASQERTTKGADHSGSKKTSLFYGEMSSQKDGKQGEKCSDKQMHQQAKNSRQDEYGTSVNKGLMVYANQVASDMMFSFLKTMKVERKGNKHAPACLVLKKVVLKHTRDVISDLIDSIMKNLHNVTGELMKNSDFVATVKKNLFSVANQKSTEILEAMVKRLFQALAGEDKEGQSRSQSLAFTSLKTGSQDPKSQAMQFTAMKSAMHNSGKDKDKGGNKSQSSSCKPSEKHCSMDKYAKDLIVTALMLIQQHLLQQTNNGKDSTESRATSFGYVSRDAHFGKAGNSQSSKSLAEASGSRPAGTRNDYQQQLNSQKEDISSILLSIIQKVLHEAGFNSEDSFSETNKSLKHTSPSEWEPGKQAVANQLNSTMEQSDNMDQVNKQFFDQLVESVIKLCLFMVKGSGTDLAIGDLSEEPNAFGTSSAKAQATARKTSLSKQNGNPLTGSSSGSQVVVTNQNANTSSQNKELQAILQWVVASQFNVPNLSFMHGNEENLKKLPLLAEKAATKGYSVGDILQEVMRYLEKQQFDATVGNITRCGLMDWLLNSL